MVVTRLRRRSTLLLGTGIFFTLFMLGYLTLREDQDQLQRNNIIKSGFINEDRSARYSKADENEPSGVNKVLKNTIKCLDITNMAQTVNKRSLALKNAQYLYEEYRTIIPTHFLSNVSNHCWRMHFDVMSSDNSFHGHLGPVKLTGGLLQGPKSLRGPLQVLQSRPFNGKFSTDLVCLPSVFLIGFPKCGSTYFWCFLKTLLRSATDTSIQSPIEIEKEPHFWVKGAANVTRYIKTPRAKDIGEYLLNFLHGLKKLSETAGSFNVPFVDGSPNTIFNWPRFDQQHPPDVNYCIIPSVLPELLPGSKFVVVMRNPLHMLYSSFWFSCTGLGHTLTREVQEKAPTIFHQRAKSKIDRFLNCMVDEQHPRPCSIEDKDSYSVCIRQRLHLLDTCVVDITYIEFEDPLPECGKARIDTVLYFSHIRKWLSIVPRSSMFFLSLEKLIAEQKTVASELLTFLGYFPSKNILKRLEVADSLCLSSENVQKIIDYKRDPKLAMKEDTTDMLQTFFEPFNSLLSDLLHDSAFNNYW